MSLKAFFLQPKRDVFFFMDLYILYKVLSSEIYCFSDVNVDISLFLLLNLTSFSSEIGYYSSY